MKAAPKPCTHPGCGALVKGGGGHCQKHPATNGFNEKLRGNRHERGYGTEWDKLRSAVMQRDNGLCQPCARQHKVTLGNAVDHIVPKAEGGTDHDTNLQTICNECHTAKTKVEAARGVRRGWGE